ncbi:MAG: hypothetical protein IPH11_16335 [Ignavibacteriales bacterium]|nr:hypothetical protein [Ignavibacteriales bacterium]
MLKKIISLLIVLNSYTLSQEFGMGLLLDDSLYANSPTAAPLMRGDYSDLPKSSSLKDKCPTPATRDNMELVQDGQPLLPVELFSKH